LALLRARDGPGGSAEKFMEEAAVNRAELEKWLAGRMDERVLKEVGQGLNRLRKKG